MHNIAMQSTEALGRCHCGNIKLHLRFAGPLQDIRPRTCDCSFCRLHCASYVSDPRGSLRIEVAREPDLGRYKQGSELADMLICRRCGVFVGAEFQYEDCAYATINVRVLDGSLQFAAAQIVSPQKLSPAEKVARWQQLWFARVNIAFSK